MIKTLLIILSLTAIGGQLCLAASEPVFTSYPSNTVNQNKWIIRDVNPGDSYEEYITIKNLSSQDIQVQLSVVETSGPKESVKVLDNQAPKNIGNWIKLENQSVQLKANEKKQVKLSLEIPDQTEQGDYQAAVFTTYTDQTSTNLTTTTRIGNRVYLNVTDKKTLYTNTFDPKLSVSQSTIIIFSVLGIILSLVSFKLENKKSMS